MLYILKINLKLIKWQLKPPLISRILRTLYFILKGIPDIETKQWRISLRSIFNDWYVKSNVLFLITLQQVIDAATAKCLRCLLMQLHSACQQFSYVLPAEKVTIPRPRSGGLGSRAICFAAAISTFPARQTIAYTVAGRRLRSKGVEMGAGKRTKQDFLC